MLAVYLGLLGILRAPA